MAKVYKSICMEIDGLAVELIHLSQRMVELKLKVEKLMESGFVNIAKARYIMGGKCVSALQLPTRDSNPIQPLATVCRNQMNGYWVFKVLRKSPSPLTSDEKLLKDEFRNNTTREDMIKELLKIGSRQMRRRKEFFLVEDKNYRELNDELQDEVSTDSSEPSDVAFAFPDPIRMFGVLVPYTLRLAQKNFQEVLNAVLNCATMQSNIHTVLVRYHHLTKVKKMIEKAAEERGFVLSEDKDYWTPSEVSSEYSVVKESVLLEEVVEKEIKSKEGMGELEFELEGEDVCEIINPDGTYEYFKYSGEFDVGDLEGINAKSNVQEKSDMGF